MRKTFAFFVCLICTSAHAQLAGFAIDPNFGKSITTQADLAAGTKLVFTIHDLPEGEDLVLQLCGPDCNSAKVIGDWTARQAKAKPEQAVVLKESGQYYLWARQTHGGMVGPDFPDSQSDDYISFRFKSGACVSIKIIPYYCPSEPAAGVGCAPRTRHSP